MEASVELEPAGRIDPERFAGLTYRDARRLESRWRSARRTRDARQRGRKLTAVARELEAAEQRVDRRRAAVPEISYPDLPVTARREDIAAAIRDHQVVVIAGETGSGKTTQLPKICLELGRGVRGLIGHTQPRRIAARAVAERIAEELGEPLGGTIGYKVRFTDRTSEESLVTVMTDGILLAEISNDPELSRYDTIVIDEAHERSLNIDFILGYLKQLLLRRPDLKLVITSATIDPQRFAAHFDDAPVIEVSGRTYPVEVRYRPLVEDRDGDTDQVQAICDAVEELWTEGTGDVLVFLSGEREIRDTADALRALSLPDTEILPLYARLSSAEQHRVFQPHGGRRVVLATNVAETSLTVPGIRYVVDPGTARISRYSARTKVQRLPIEPISQASADQRKGRCGRVAAGVCIRLYTEEDFLGRPEYTDPEILRTSLASVILQMATLGLGEVADFPFVDPPDRRQIRDGVQLLEELGALQPGEPDPRKRLTELGRRIAQLPVDPRLARMILEADVNGCVREVMVIAAALSIQDPRERPTDKQQAADDKHRRFADKESDFATYLHLWQYLQEQQKELSSSQFRRLCKAEFLNYLRVREWQDVYSQLRQLARQVGVTLNSSPADAQRIHQSLLAGLLSHIGLRDMEKREYAGARGARFALNPGSTLFRKPPQLVMVAELVETTRLWGRVAARIDPAWAESAAAHLVKRTHSEPHWEKDRGAVMAYEKVLLYGVPLVAARKVSYAKVDPELCRELFLRHALVEGDWRTHHAFWKRNQELLREVEHLEHRTRRRDIVVDDETVFAFYDARVPPHVVSSRHFDAWWKKARHTTPDLLTFDEDFLVGGDADAVDAEAFPDCWRQGDVELALSYRFEPGTDADGVTVLVPVEVLNRLDADDFAWQVPGLREELVTTLIRSLPKPIRVGLVPAPDHARALLRHVEHRSGPLLTVLGRGIDELTGVQVRREDWDIGRLPAHLRMRFVVVDADGRTLGEGDDLRALRDRLAPKVRTTVARAAATIERVGIRAWDVDEVPRAYEQVVGGHTVRGFPALVDEGAAVALRVLATASEQRRAMRAGVRRLLLTEVGAPAPKPLVAGLDNRARLALGTSPYDGVPALLEDCVVCAGDSVLDDAGGVPWTRPAYEAVRTLARRELFDRSADVVATTASVLAERQALQVQLQGTSSLLLLPALADVREQAAQLVSPGFVSRTGRRRLPDLVRYLRAASRRLDKLPTELDRDRVRMQQVQRMADAYAELLARLPEQRHDDEDVVAVRWLIEELRVSLFAQALGTATPVSEQRILRAIEALRPD